MSAEPVLKVNFTMIEFGRFVFNETLSGVELGKEETTLEIPYAFTTTTSSRYSVYAEALGAT